MSNDPKVIGYLPDEKPPFWKLILYALQQIIVMFPATILVALLTGFHLATTIFASGFATLGFILVTKRKIPLYYGSSFSYLSAIIGLTGGVAFGEVLPDSVISGVQFGIMASGLVSIAAGFIVSRFGRKSIEKVLPATVTGPIAMIIGLTLATNAISDAAPVTGAVGITGTNWVWVISLITLVATILFSVYLKGFLGQIPLLLGPIVGCIAAAIVYLITKQSMFRALPEAAFAGTQIINGVIAIPHFTLPRVDWIALAAIMPIAIATIPESTAHVFQLDIYVNDLAKKKGTGKTYDIGDRLGSNLIGDGLGDILASLFGGPAGTNYGENISTMAITKVFSVYVLIAAAIIAMILSFFSPVVNVIYGIPQAVIGGIEIFLFGAIAAQGIAIMIDRKCDMFDARNIAVIAVIMIIGIGGQYQFGGMIPFFGIKVPCIAGAAIAGILLNLLLSIGRKKEKTEE
ncbi:MAG TPA: solute carrier family 23 protein [Feifaniaceae bacterium]|nr:solute carrier family 23 protein [Feifaniaceae bacterium]